MARRERLKALRDAAEGDNVEESPVSGVGPTLKFRNYAVRDEKHIQHEKVYKPNLRSVGMPISNVISLQVAAAQPPKFEEPVIEKKAVEILAQQVNSALHGSDACMTWHGRVPSIDSNNMLCSIVSNNVLGFPGCTCQCGTKESQLGLEA